MKGLGTVINALAIIAGGVLGILCKKYGYISKMVNIF